MSGGLGLAIMRQGPLVVILLAMSIARHAEQIESGVLPHEMGLFVRSDAELGRAQAAVDEADLSWKVLDEQLETQAGHVSITTMHLAQGWSSDASS